MDVFNEGLDLPELDTVLMLRPTESPILWLQQFGRGLRKTKEDKQLTVIRHPEGAQRPKDLPFLVPLLLVTRRHVPTWFEATEEERHALTQALDQARSLIETRHHPDAFNIGINVGEAAGQTVPIPAKANYLKAETTTGTPTASRLVSGGEDDPLFPYLTEELARSIHADNRHRFREAASSASGLESSGRDQ